MPNISVSAQLPPTTAPTGPLVVALVYDGLCTFEFGITAEIFGLTRPEFGNDWYRFASCAIEDGPLRAAGGLSISADQGIDALDHADIIVVPGWKSADANIPANLKDRLVIAHRRGARLVSICSGAFVLAATGLLDGKTATTHWRYAEQLRSRFPSITVDEASLYRLENRVSTSAGSAAGIDLMLEIIRRDYGPDKANSVARRLVVPAQRQGGQAQYLERPVSCRPESAIAPLLEDVRRRLSENWTIEGMAAGCHMSARTFQRRFIDAVGLTPGDWLTGERIEAAKEILITGRQDMETVAALVGFGSAHALRHHFRKRLGLSPTDYRHLFRSDVA
ncbi:transcriptional regulator FtrA [Labrenzia sp. VG12]|uniref:transcriptional regulator FtrA n=1 Tax=Labrenzia sp. VG12 TaxID=2021862 RepID=UPI0018E02374|nr:transcriptional regulator FtrA [Labrenzia sp. VG12]